ncbi:flagellar hook-associated protein FlgK [Neorhizobium alkalisoli]|uniref:Flagellar hook-associated protein 1 n=1 Tax=Neorhizobium alkalisoli TaxID=528178 RepID=A0A561QST0_9HYPH|nr:flagellar hook-associated protein FlgK [Neorhizobium alkalisoli]TWF53377.1 flagellar hook-associated protein 1 FlgK [Neorhizobium alkalisoli]
MSLASALSSAQSIFTNTGTQSSVTSKNIANAQNPDYVRRSAVVVTGGNGAMIGDTVRSANQPLLRQTLESTASSSGQRTLLNGLEEIKSLMGGNDYESSPATLLAAFRNNLDAYSSKANDNGLALAVVSSAQDVVTSLNSASNQLQSIRKRADDSIQENVSDLNTLLSKFQDANDQVKNLTATGGDPNDALDTRDSLLKQISEIVGVSSYTRTNNDMVLYTSDGTMLFEGVARKVTFQPTSSYDASTVGNAVYIDGVQLKAGTNGDTSAKGSLASYLQLRDDIAPTFQGQLDEIARGLITSFAETDPNDPATLDPAPGLFTWTDGGVQQTTVPDGVEFVDNDGDGVDETPVSGSATVAGLASRIKVNPAVVPPAGSTDLIRDGGINGTDYVVNTDGGSSYSDLLDKYNQALEDPMAFDPSTQIADSSNLMSLASNSVGWLEQLRSSATTADETKYAMLTRSVEAYSSETGVSLDEELSLLLDIEQSYKAGAKLMSTVDEMMKALMDIAS